MGLALRTSALLEPHAPPGCAVVEEKFYEFGSSGEARREFVDSGPVTNGGELSGNPMAPLNASDVPNFDYNRDDERFVLRKNLLDPPYHTKLWKISLD
jgi:hypothetical protein